MKTKKRYFILYLALFAAIAGPNAPKGFAHIIPPENYHPLAESYRRMFFILKVHPIQWELVKKDAEVIADHFQKPGSLKAKSYRNAISTLIDQVRLAEEPLSLQERREKAEKIFKYSTENIAQFIIDRLDAARSSLDDFSQSKGALREARQIWASFDYEIQHSDPKAFVRLGRAWLELSAALGNPGVLDVGAVPPDKDAFRKYSKEIILYLNQNYAENFQVAGNQMLPLPLKSKTYQPELAIPVKLPPGNNINKQVPRPRQILNMAARGVDEAETALIALGDMAFDSTFIFGEPAQSLSITCNTCHNKSITNPQFFIPGLSKYAGGMDVSNSFFAPHATNGVFDPLDIPDLRGIRFTAPYGRNSRTASLREFVRNVIMHEFNGPEPDPLILDSIIAYMNEFDFLPNEKLNADGSLNDRASASAKRGEKLFNTPLKQMGNKSCATCHVPSNNFLDRQSHDIGTVKGVEPYSRDRSMDTPTLLGIKYTAPYFHDGSQPSIKDVVRWFNQTFGLNYKDSQVEDLTAYVETVGDGVDAYEDTPYYLDAEMEEFSFFLSSYEYLKKINKPELMNITFKTIAQEIKNHKWELQDPAYIPVMDELAQIMLDAVEANLSKNYELLDRKVEDYRELYSRNVDHLK